MVNIFHKMRQKKEKEMRGVALDIVSFLETYFCYNLFISSSRYPQFM